MLEPAFIIAILFVWTIDYACAWYRWRKWKRQIIDRLHEWECSTLGVERATVSEVIRMLEGN